MINYEYINKAKRAKEKDRNIIISEFINLIVCDNYIKDNDFKAKMRVTSNTNDFIETENKIQELRCKTQKKYIKTIQKPTISKK